MARQWLSSYSTSRAVASIHTIVHGSPMRLVKYRDEKGAAKVGVLDGDVVRALVDEATLTQVGFGSDPRNGIEHSSTGASVPMSAVTLLAPIDAQEVWAAGVTYLRSKTAREEESATAGGASFYDRVHTASRPELFFKATPRRVVGPGQPIRVRADSRWTVPGPELALGGPPDLRNVGYTIGNDVSARDIEGENPLYLPQAKVYKQSCSIGPCVTLAAALPPRAEVGIRL